MEGKENVYGESNATEQVTKVKAASGEIGLPQEGSAVAGKFKDVSALVRAYESLQSEFTRRSQRLKELEKLMENLKTEPSAVGDSGAEKLRKNAQNRRERTKAFDEFVSDMRLSRGQAGPVDEGESPQVATAENSAENAEETVTANSVGVAEKMANGRVRVETTAKESEASGGKDAPSVAGNEPSGDELYRQVCQDEGVRLRIIGEYLATVGKSAPPITAAGVGTFVSPPRKAKNIGDAAAMALQYFKKP